MNVSLTLELEKFVSAKVASGRYSSASEVVRQALRLLEEYDQNRDAQRRGETFNPSTAADSFSARRARGRGLFGLRSQRHWLIVLFTSASFRCEVGL